VLLLLLVHLVVHLILEELEPLGHIHVLHIQNVIQVAEDVLLEARYIWL